MGGKMQTLLERLTRYVRINTRSDEESETYPSTECQWDLAKLLEKECRELGLEDVNLDRFGYVTATIPATAGMENTPVIGFISHMDTSPETSGENVKVCVHPDYDGKPIVLDSEGRWILSPEDFPELKKMAGKTLVTTDGSTLLGGDDKCGIAIIMAAAEALMQSDAAPHGKVRIAFTPDEEIGRGVEFFDPEAFGADFGYTMDGGGTGDVEFECFNAAKALVYFHGQNIHPGGAKGKMVNSQRLAARFLSLLPADEIPEKTEGYEGFIHLLDMHGDVAETRLHFILRDFESDGLERRKKILQEAAATVESEYGKGRVECVISDQYRNMKEKVSKHPEVIELAFQAIRDCGLEPTSVPIRGGTDGASISNMPNGFPCPNLSTGDHNCHGRFEYAVLEEMETDLRMVLRIIQLAGNR